MLVDTHCHLDQLEGPEAVLAAAREAGVHRVVAVAEGLDGLPEADRLRAEHPDTVLLAVGLHPVSLLDLPESAEGEALETIRGYLDRAVEVGEVGLDHKVATTDEEKDRQLRFLGAQFELAAEARLPVNLHSRRTERAVLNEAIAFHRETGLGAQLHWFTHSKKLVRIANEAGVFVSAGPAVLSDEQQLSVAAEVREDLLLLETDGPVRFEGETAVPEWIPRVCTAVAGARGVTPEELARRTTENFDRFLGLGKGGA